MLRPLARSSSHKPLTISDHWFILRGGTIAQTDLRPLACPIACLVPIVSQPFSISFLRRRNSIARFAEWGYHNLFVDRDVKTLRRIWRNQVSDNRGFTHLPRPRQNIDKPHWLGEPLLKFRLFRPCVFHCQ